MKNIHHELRFAARIYSTDNHRAYHQGAMTASREEAEQQAKCQGGVVVVCCPKEIRQVRRNDQADQREYSDRGNYGWTITPSSLIV